MAPNEATVFVYAKIPESIGPIDRGAKYEDPIAAKLQAQRFGEITGGGSQLGDERPDGTRPIEFCGIDFELENLERGLSLLRTEFQALGAPDGTELHYEMDGQALQDELHGSGWRLRQPRTFRHPAFDS